MNHTLNLMVKLLIKCSVLRFPSDILVKFCFRSFPSVLHLRGHLGGFVAFEQANELAPRREKHRRRTPSSVVGGVFALGRDEDVRIVASDGW